MRSEGHEVEDPHVEGKALVLSPQPSAQRLARPDSSDGIRRRLNGELMSPRSPTSPTSPRSPTSPTSPRSPEPSEPSEGVELSPLVKPVKVDEKAVEWRIFSVPVRIHLEPIVEETASGHQAQKLGCGFGFCRRRRR